PFRALDVDQQQHMRARQRLLRSIPDSRGQTGDGKSDLLERRGEQQVLFETVPAAFPPYELGLKAVEIEMNRPAEQNVQVLERDVRRMRQVQRFEHGERGLPAASV